MTLYAAKINEVIEALLTSTTIVSGLDELPPAANGVITLEDNRTYRLQGTVDLMGARLVCGANNVIMGDSSENTMLKSTGLSGTALITSSYSLPMRNLAITADIAVDLQGDGVSTALDWTAVNFVDCGSVGTVADYSNFIMTDSAFLNSGGMAFDGTIGTIGFSGCLFSVPAGATGISIAATCEVTRRFRLIYSALVVPATATGITVPAEATIPVEGFILDTINFSGAGTYVSGVQGSSDYAKWVNCVGVTNSAAIANMYVVENATATTIAGTGTPVQVAGTSAVAALNQRFTHDQDTNALEYTPTNPRLCRAQASVTLTAAQNNVIGVYICRRPDGDAIDPPNQVLAESEVYVTASGTRPDSIFLQAIVTLEQGDDVYVAVENNTAVNNVTVSFMNLLVEQASI